MRQVFADTAYWLALSNPFDQYYQDALRSSATLGRTRIVTSEAVLIEYLNALADKGESIRRAAIRSVEAIMTNPGVTVVPLSRKAFQKGFALYKARPDKGYSLTDCLSMTMMRAHRILHVLTTDHHFEQEEFTLLMAGGRRG